MASSKKSKQKVPVKVPVVEPVLPTPEAPTEALQQIYNLFAEEFAKVNGAKEKGSNTDNGGIIDQIIKDGGGRIGWAYCALTVTAITKRVCKRLDIGFPKGLEASASSQALKNECDKKYLRSEPAPWYAFVHTNPGDKAHGHTGFSTSYANTKGEYPTAEGNFANKVGYFTKNLSYAKVFVDYPQAILDQIALERKG